MVSEFLSILGDSVVMPEFPNAGVIERCNGHKYTLEGGFNHLEVTYARDDEVVSQIDPE